MQEKGDSGLVFNYEPSYDIVACFSEISESECGA